MYCIMNTGARYSVFLSDRLKIVIQFLHSGFLGVYFSFEFKQQSDW